ncbi:hypothetical protein C0992_006093 [Termitomyces sp. T32_za158]|nr:hypothetical protein C0992_006093 [Termitomyces sp. T32_za158]
MDTYLCKAYLKIASLIAKGARAAAILSGCAHNTAMWQDVAYAYGRNVGIAYQLVEDMLRNPARARVSGPILFATEEHTELRPLIRRDLAGEGDIEKARDYMSSEHKSVLDVLALTAATKI